MSDTFDLLPALLEGTWVTVQVFAGATVFAIAAALVAGVARRSSFAPLRWTAAVYVEVFRGTSALVQLFWFYFVLPQLGIFLPRMAVGIVVLGLNYGAYGAEIVRGAIRAVPAGQTEAAIALNMSRWQRMRRIVLPQAVVRMLPPWGNIEIELLKNSALVQFIGIADLSWQGKVLAASTLEVTEIFTATLIIYFALALVVTGLVRLLEHTLGRGLRAGGG